MVVHVEDITRVALERGVQLWAAGIWSEVGLGHSLTGAVHRAADPVEVDVSGKGIGRSHRSGLLGQLLHHRLLLVVVAPTCSFGTPYATHRPGRRLQPTDPTRIYGHEWPDEIADDEAPWPAAKGSGRASRSPVPCRSRSQCSDRTGAD